MASRAPAEGGVVNVAAYTADEIKSLVRPCVYAFFRGDKVVYVGKSCQGILRPFSPGHHMRCGGRYGKKTVRKPDKVVVFWVNKQIEADVLEQRPIYFLRPIHNTHVRKFSPPPDDTRLSQWFFSSVSEATVKKSTQDEKRAEVEALTTVTICNI